MYTYQNGNCTVSLYRDGRKVREWPDGEEPKPEFPESVDLKITNYCTVGCPYCHESSTPKGQHADWAQIRSRLMGLPAGVEIAIGGGDPMSHPDLGRLLSHLRQRGLVPNLTVHTIQARENQFYLKELQETEFIFGVGVSDPKRCLQLLGRFPLKNVVCHAIVGVHQAEDVGALLMVGQNVLLLGYKRYGFGVDYCLAPPYIWPWKSAVVELLRIGKGILSFDNLALEQLGVKELVPPELWQRHYMGDDGQFTMYYDAVAQQYAKSSTSERLDGAGMTIREMFQQLKELP